MKLIPLLTAVVVTVFLYFLVIERDTLLAFANAQESPEAEKPEEVATTDDEEVSEGAIRVSAIRSVATQIDSAVVLRGETEAARQVDVRAETSGQVISEPLRKGAFVTDGQLVCQLDPGTRAASLAEAQARLSEAQARVPEAQARVPEAQARVPEAQARLDEAMARLDEAKINNNAANKLNQGGFASETRVASTQAAVRAAEAAVAAAKSGLQSTEAGIESAEAGIQSAAAGIESAEAAIASVNKDIERLEIHAPFAGLLESDAAELGSLLQPGGLCATIIQLDPIKVVGFVPETDVNRIEVGALAGARLSGGQEVQGRVNFLSRSADPTTRTFRVEIHVPNADLRIRDGQTAEILIAAEGNAAHLLPQSALTLNDEGDLGVRLVSSDSTAQFAPLKLLRDTSEGVWVAGLPETANVITIGQEYVVDGVSVQPTYEEPQQ